MRGPMGFLDSVNWKAGWTIDPIGHHYEVVSGHDLALEAGHHQLTSPYNHR